MSRVLEPNGGETAAAVPASRLTSQPCEVCGSMGVDAFAPPATLLLVCARCGHEESRRRLPFFSITGPSGSGKSTLLRRLWRELPECDAFDGDALWHGGYWNDRAAFYGRWLVLAGQASQSGRATVVCTAAMPEDWELSDFRVFVEEVHMLALVCDEQELLARLEARGREPDPEAPADFLMQTLTFNTWLREHLEHIDTSVLDRERTAAYATEWVRRKLSDSHPLDGSGRRDDPRG